MDGSTTVFAYVLARSRRPSPITHVRHTRTTHKGAPPIANPVDSTPIEFDIPDDQRFRPGRRSGYVDPDWDPAVEFVRTETVCVEPVSTRRMGAYTDITDQPWRRGILALLIIGVFGLGIALAMQPEPIQLPGLIPEPAAVVVSVPTAVPARTA